MSDYLIKINEVSLQDKLFNLELAENKKPRFLGAENIKLNLSKIPISHLLLSIIWCTEFLHFHSDWCLRN